MSNTANNPTKVITGPNTRWSYCNAWEAKAIQGGTPKFSVSLIIPKSDKKTIAKIEEAIKAAYREGEAKLKGNGRSVPALSVLKTPLRDGDVERPDDEAYADSYFVNANSTTAPGIVDADRQPILDHALQVGTDSEGGYLVPDEYERTLVEALEEENIFRQMAKVIKTSSGDRKIPVVASKGTASWIDEESAYPESDDSFGQVSIGAYKLGTMIKVSEELLNDSVFDLQSYISREFARRIGAKETCLQKFREDGEIKAPVWFNGVVRSEETVVLFNMGKTAAPLDIHIYPKSDMAAGTVRLAQGVGGQRAVFPNAVKAEDDVALLASTRECTKNGVPEKKEGFYQYSAAWDSKHKVALEGGKTAQLLFTMQEMQEGGDVR